MPSSYIPVRAPYTTYKDFVGQIRIPNLNPSTYTTDDPPELIEEREIDDGNIVELNRFIAKYEKELFTDLLSKAVYDLLVNAYAGIDPPSQELTLLYSKLMENPIAANLTYYWFMRDSETMTGGVGEVKPKSENATPTTAAPKMVRAWNEMHDWLVTLCQWLTDNEADYQCQARGVHFYEVLHKYAPINLLNL
jgi:hypothetical protein